MASVYAAFANGGAIRVTALDLAGKLVWQSEAGKFNAEHGYGSSPAIHEALIIVSGDSPAGAFLTAPHRKTGQVVWRTARPGIGSYGTPTLATVAGKPQVLLHGGDIVAGYDPESGKELWRCEGPATTCGSTVAFQNDMVFASGGYPQHRLLGIQVSSAGDKASIAWESNKGVAYVPSPLVHEGRLIVVEDDGVASSFDASTGKPGWKHRLSGGFTASPILAGGLVFATNEAGTTHIFRPGSKFESVAENSVGEPVFASPVIAGGKLYLRTAQSLYCIGVKAEENRAPSVSFR